MRLTRAAQVHGRRHMSTFFRDDRRVDGEAAEGDRSRCAHGARGLGPGLAHLGEFVPRDMVAVKVSGQQRAAIVAAPAYFESHARPKTPRDLTGHRCLGHARCGVPVGVRETGHTRHRVGLRAPQFACGSDKDGRSRLFGRTVRASTLADVAARGGAESSGASCSWCSPRHRRGDR